MLKRIILILLFLLIITGAILIICIYSKYGDVVLSMRSVIKVGDETANIGKGYGEDVLYREDRFGKTFLVSYGSKNKKDESVHIYVDKNSPVVEFNLFYDSVCLESPCHQYKDVFIKLYEGQKPLSEYLLKDSNDKFDFKAVYSGQDEITYRIKLSTSFYRLLDDKIVVQWFDHSEFEQFIQPTATTSTESEK